MKIECKSSPDNFYKEKLGSKTATIRVLDGKDVIEITNTETKEKIVKKITDISIWKGNLRNCWKRTPRGM